MEKEQIVPEINALKSMLSQTDYQCLKYAEGAITEEAYTPIRAKRAEWRRKINELEQLLEATEGYTE